MKKLPEVPVWLKDAWTAPALNVLLESTQHTRVQGRKSDHEQELNEVIGNGACHQNASPDDCVREPTKRREATGIASGLRDFPKSKKGRNDQGRILRGR